MAVGSLVLKLSVNNDNEIGGYIKRSINHVVFISYLKGHITHWTTGP